MTWFRGPTILCVQGVANAQSMTAIPCGIPTADGQACASRPLTSTALSREFGGTAQSITNWVGQATIDSGKPLPSREGLITVEREELMRLRRQMRQVQMERIPQIHQDSYES